VANRTTGRRGTVEGVGERATNEPGTQSRGTESEPAQRRQRAESIPESSPAGNEKGVVRPKARTHLVVRPTAVLTPEIEFILDELDGFLRADKMIAQVTSGVRTAEQQLALIKKRSVAYGLHSKYPSILVATVDDTDSWHDAWDELLNVKKFIVNPPRPVVSKRRGSGKLMGISPHMARMAFDLAGPSLVGIEASVHRYKREGGLISQALLETENKAVHVTIRRYRDFSEAITEYVLDPAQDEFLREPANHGGPE
jgi:hypothetical protein